MRALPPVGSLRSLFPIARRCVQRNGARHCRGVLAHCLDYGADGITHMGRSWSRRGELAAQESLSYATTLIQ
eukprot:1453282-Prymnesium_polylepis.1